MNRDEIWQAIDAQRTSLAALLEELTDAEWTRPSLCESWTVRDVAAHLTMQQLGPVDAMAILFKWRGSMDKTTQHVARLRAAAWPTGRLIAGIRGTVGSRRHNVGVSYLETLCDILVHSQDIAIPLDRRLDMPPAAAAVSASRVLTMRFPPPLPSARRMAGFRLTATDTAWSTGDGPEIRGPMAALLLVCCGRYVALPQLSGDGVAELAARISTPVGEQR